MPPADAGNQLPPKIPGYEIFRLIGEGGMGRVYLAHQEALERNVCIKLLSKATEAPTPAVRARFEREAKILAMAAHPHVLTILDFGAAADDGTPYIVTEYIENGDLRKLLRDGRPIPPARRRSILDQIGQALAYLHGKGILHRDLKPENILTPTDSLVKVADFGLAVLHDDVGRLTQSSRGLGTLVYASPEQQTGGPVDERSDQYSLAAIAYEMTTGKRPVGSFKPPSAIAAGADDRLDAVLMKALSHDRAARYADLNSFLKDLDEALAPAATTARRPILAGCLVAVALAVAYLVGTRPEPTPSPPQAPLPLKSDPQTPPPPKGAAARQRLIEMRAGEIWKAQGSPRGEGGKAVALDNWLRAENQVDEAINQRAYRIWQSQGSPSGDEGKRVAEPNRFQAATELLQEALHTQTASPPRP